MKNTSRKNNLWHLKNSRGFTLIEVLIAVSIFAASLAALLLTVGTGIGDVTVAKNRVVADYLAQEGIELVRYQRDYFAQTEPNGWGQLFQSGSGIMDTNSNGAHCIGSNLLGANQCGVSALLYVSQGEGAAPINCSGTHSANCDVVQDPATGAYDILGDNTAITSTWQKTPFVRYVYLEPPSNSNIPSGQAYVIHSVVKWSEGTGTYTTQMTDTIYNWF